MTDGTLFSRELADGRCVDVIPLTFGRARLVVTSDPDRCWYDGGW